MRIIITHLIFSVSLLLSVNVFAGISVIVHPNNVNTIDAKQIRAMYLAKTNAFPDGGRAIPFGVADNNEMKKRFSKELLRKSPSSLNSYWSRMIFYAKGKPPKPLSMAAVKAKIAMDKSAIGYIDSELVDESVKEIFQIQ